MAPLTATAFAQVTVAGLALNFLAVPLMSVVQVAGLAVVDCAPAFITRWRGPRRSWRVWAARGITDSARAVDLAPWTRR